MDKHALIIAHGELPPTSKLRKILREASTIVCADGGAIHAVRLGLRPHVVIGDLDSLPLSVRRRLKGSTIIRSSEQNHTDLEKALLYLLRQKVKRITIIGATGRRIDHSLANISLLKKYHRRVHLRLIDPTATVEMVHSSVRFQATPGETISLLPIGRTSGITTRGLLYPLKNEALELGSRGVSNQVTERTVEIRIRKGSVLLVRLF